MLSLIVLCSLTACQPGDSREGRHEKALAIPERESKNTTGDTMLLEKELLAKGLVDIQSLDSSVHVSLHYATNHNFLHRVMYEGLYKCYLPCEVALKLCNAQHFLKRQYPYYNIVVFDAVRPLHIQQNMWDEFDMPAAQKINYIAHPKELSLHNYGAALDVGLISNEGALLDMGTVFDAFDSLSQPKWERYFIQNGKLSQAALNNRLILRSVMQRSGFTPITSEWWHFNATNKSDAATRFALIE